MNAPTPYHASKKMVIIRFIQAVFAAKKKKRMSNMTDKCPVFLIITKLNLPKRHK